MGCPSFHFRLDGKHCVFGKVVEGYDEVIAKIETYGSDGDGKTSKKITIADCGQC